MKLTDYITQDNLREFCFNNIDIIEGEIKGIAVEFFGMNMTWPLWEPNDVAKEMAKRGIVLVQPLYNPWAWMSDCAVATVDREIDLVKERAHLDPDAPVCAFGGSMGGYGTYIFPTKSKHNVIRAVVNSGPTDLIAFCVDREYTNRTLMTAFWNDSGEGDFEQVMRDRSPINMIDQMKKIPYHIYHCRGDSLVPLRHSENFIAAAKDRLELTFRISETNEHCEMTPEDTTAFYDDVAAAFE